MKRRWLFGFRLALGHQADSVFSTNRLSNYYDQGENLPVNIKGIAVVLHKSQLPLSDFELDECASNAQLTVLYENNFKFYSLLIIKLTCTVSIVQLKNTERSTIDLEPSSRPVMLAKVAKPKDQRKR